MTDKTPARITLDRVSLSVPTFVQRERQAKSWGSMFLGAALDPPRRQLVRLLDEISFEVNEGDRVAILGRNGAGKSTLLRVLNGVYQPTSGSMHMTGSCQALLNLSLGFNGEATVRENIFLRGTAMGINATRLRDHIEPILEFAELWEKSNHRLRTLSAGQRMRLGFAISTSMQHDVMLMDEWVGAGDQQFMAKAKQRMLSRVGGSKIVMLASHSVGLLRDVCNRGLVLEGGRLVYTGDIVSSLQAYHQLLAQLREGTPPEARSEPSGNELTYGYVEGASFEGGLVQLKGWCVDTAGQAPEALVLEHDGIKYAATRFQRHARPDVMRHMGLGHDQCGFSASFTVPHVASLVELGPDIQVLGGSSVELAHAPLRLAGGVLARLQAPDNDRTQ